MKLKYEKPLIAVEQYALSQAIAACSTLVSFNNNECMANDPDVPEQMRNMASVGMFGEGRCSIPPVGMEEDFETNVCYNISSNLLFCS